MLFTNLDVTVVSRQKLPEAWFMPHLGSVGGICDWIATITLLPLTSSVILILEAFRLEFAAFSVKSRFHEVGERGS
jgi:hypothetical protein